VKWMAGVKAIVGWGGGVGPDGALEGPCWAGRAAVTGSCGGSCTCHASPWAAHGSLWVQHLWLAIRDAHARVASSGWAPVPSHHSCALHPPVKRWLQNGVLWVGPSRALCSWCLWVAVTSSNAVAARMQLKHFTSAGCGIGWRGKRGGGSGGFGNRSAVFVDVVPYTWPHCGMPPPPCTAPLLLQIRRGSRDYLNLAVNSAFLQSTSKFRLDPANASAFFGADASAFAEEVAFSDELTKINRKRKRQTRCIVVTNLALFNYKLGKYKSFQRRISLFNLDKVVQGIHPHTTPPSHHLPLPRLPPPPGPPTPYPVDLAPCCHWFLEVVCVI
jgi:hypothetical protein